MEETARHFAALQGQVRSLRVLAAVALALAIGACAAFAKVYRDARAVHDHLVTGGITVVDTDGRTMITIGRFPDTIRGGSVTVYGRPVAETPGSWSGTATLGVHDSGGFVSTSRGLGLELVRLSQTADGAGLVELFNERREVNRLGPLP